MRAAAVLVLLSLLGLCAPAVAGGDECIPRCEIGGTTAAVVPPVALVSSGSAVTWTALDGMVHTASALDWCFSTLYGPGAPAQVTFRVAEGALYAHAADRPEKACAGAIALPDGSFLIDYVCAFHPMMDGKLIITPEVSQ